MITDSALRDIKKIVDFRGRKVHYQAYKVGMSLNSYWDSGSRDYWYYISVFGHSAQLINVIPQNGTPFDGLNLKTQELSSENTVLVKKTVIAGKTTSITIYARA